MYKTSNVKKYCMANIICFMFVRKLYASVRWCGGGVIEEECGEIIAENRTYCHFPNAY